MLEILQQFIPQLSRKELVTLIDQLKAALAEEIATPACDLEACPRCGCMDFTKKGVEPDGTQRYLCKGCERTFSAKTHNLLANSKLKPAVWMTFAECMADDLSLRESATRCGVSLYTSWFMRMRVCEIMARRLQAPRKGVFHVDETLVADNLSGNQDKSWFTLPRKPRRNGQDGRHERRGRSKEHIVVECGINEYGDCFCDAIDRGSPGKGALGLNLLERIPKGSTIVSDAHPSYRGLSDGITHEVIDLNDPTTGNINMVNALHSRLKGFLRGFHGVSTKRLQRYLDWFCYIEQYKRSDMDRRRLLYDHEANGRYYSTRKLMHLEVGTFMVYWTSGSRRKVNSGLT